MVTWRVWHILLHDLILWTCPLVTEKRKKGRMKASCIRTSHNEPNLNKKAFWHFFGLAHEFSYMCVCAHVCLCIYEYITAATVSSRHGFHNDSRWAVKVTRPAAACVCVCSMWWISFISSVSLLLWVSKGLYAWAKVAGGRVCEWYVCLLDHVRARESVCFCHFASLWVCVSVWQRLTDGSSTAWSIADGRRVSIAGGSVEECVQSNVCWQARWTSRGNDDLNLLQVTPPHTYPHTPTPQTHTHKQTELLFALHYF